MIYLGEIDTDDYSPLLVLFRADAFIRQEKRRRELDALKEKLQAELDGFDGASGDDEAVADDLAMAGVRRRCRSNASG